MIASVESSVPALTQRMQIWFHFITLSTPCLLMQQKETRRKRSVRKTYKHEETWKRHAWCKGYPDQAQQNRSVSFISEYQRLVALFAGMAEFDIIDPF